MEDCVFCKIIKGKIPCFKIFENDSYIAFFDIFPRSKGHTLVVPKKHIRWITDLSDIEFQKLWSASYKVTKKLSQFLKPTFTSYLTYGLDVTHAHIHVIPRFNESSFIPEAAKGNLGDLKKLASRINGKV